MIPKIIHYCWFGGKPLPEECRAYIATWKKYCPDYEIVEWNEQNFDVNCTDYTREAAQAKKWAFVSDYARLYALKECGGIYLDTDVEMLKNPDRFLENRAFSGFEREDAVVTAVMGAEKDHPFIEKLLDEYRERHFIKADGSLDLKTNVVSITEAALQAGLKLNNKKQTICDVTFYPRDYFSPKDSRTLDVKITENTCTIHHFQGTWDTDNKLRRTIKRIFPTPVLKVIVKVMDILKVK